jgi:hypothetical protein
MEINFWRKTRNVTSFFICFDSDHFLGFWGTPLTHGPKMEILIFKFDQKIFKFDQKFLILALFHFGPGTVPSISTIFL